MLALEHTTPHVRAVRRRQPESKRRRPATARTALVASVCRAYANEKRASSRTVRALLRARSRGVAYKELALDIAERLGGVASEDVVEVAAKLEQNFRQRVARHRRNGVTADHGHTVAGVVAVRARSMPEENMTDPYGKPRYVREREIFYDEVPPDVGPDLGGDDEFDHNLGEDKPPGVAGTCDDKE